MCVSVTYIIGVPSHIYIVVCDESVYVNQGGVQKTTPPHNSLFKSLTLLKSLVLVFHETQSWQV
jgi:hypothetical protein